MFILFLVEVFLAALRISVAERAVKEEFVAGAALLRLRVALAAERWRDIKVFVDIVVGGLGGGG